MKKFIQKHPKAISLGLTALLVLLQVGTVAAGAAAGYAGPSPS